MGEREGKGAQHRLTRGSAQSAAQGVAELAVDWFGPNVGLGRAGRAVRWRQAGAACARVWIFFIFIFKKN